MTNAPLTLLYDGTCPVCAHEMVRLARLDHHRRLRYVDIAANGFDCSRYGVSREHMMTLMHAVRADGSMLVGVDALHAAYEAVGLGWLWAPARWPLLRPLADWIYVRFARYRMTISRMLGMRCPGNRCEAFKEENRGEKW